MFSTKLLTEAKHFLRKALVRPRAEKIFCIGRNKTGTTSLEQFFKANGFIVGNQHKAELLVEDWAKGDFTRLVNYCKSAEVFQDLPFSLAGTYQAMDRAFPGSKFILTVRNSPDEWYHSLVRFHAKLCSSRGSIPTQEELRRFRYRGRYPGWLLRIHELVYEYPKTPLYDQSAYTAQYEQHNQDVRHYFSARPDDLLVVNLAGPTAFEQLCRFTGLNPTAAKPLPHLNKSA